ncbi:Uncharacterised protein [Mycobacterium tuberculosis]|nr:Uncharacterised protein [Mycobacterium tuberculosis]
MLPTTGMAICPGVARWRRTATTAATSTATASPTDT